MNSYSATKPLLSAKAKEVFCNTEFDPGKEQRGNIDNFALCSFRVYTAEFLVRAIKIQHGIFYSKRRLSTQRLYLLTKHTE